MSAIRRCPDHDVFDGDSCPSCGGTGPVVLPPDRRLRLSKLLSGALRHFPDDLGLAVDDEGWVDLGDLVDAVHTRHGWADETAVRAVAATDEKGRFEIADDRIRATYGHSIAVELPDDAGDIPDVLYHGTDPANLDEIRQQGLKPMSRQEVHLSTSVEDAVEVGRRHCEDPAVLEVDGQSLAEVGIPIHERGDSVYTVRRVPWRFCKVIRE